MEVRLIAEPEGGEPRDVVVDLDPGTSARRLLDELAVHLGRPPGDFAAAQSERTGAWLAGDQAVGEAGLCDGDRLLLSRRLADGHGELDVGEDDEPLVDLVVVGGPASGHRVPMQAGRHIVGRGPGADVVVDDRSMSRTHFTVDVTQATVTVADAGSSNGTFVHGRPVDAPRVLGDSDMLEAGRSLISFATRTGSASAARVDAAGRLAFNRPPRVANPPVRRDFAVPAPPPDEEKPRISVGSMMLPLVLGVGMYAITRSPVLLLISVLSPALALWSYFETKRRGRRGRGKAVEEFRAALEETVAELESARAQELRARHAGGPDAAELRARVEELRPSLWERRPGDDDFLKLRVGTFDLPSEVRATIERGGAKDLRVEAEERLGRDAVGRSSPVLVPLERGYAGLAGDRRSLEALARWLLVQAAVLHSPGELRIAAAVADDHVSGWDWLKWLPHAAPADLAVGAAAADSLLERLADTGGKRTFLLVDGHLAVGRARLAAAVASGVVGIWLGRDVRDLPGACSHVLELAPDRAALRLTDVAAGSMLEDIAADGVPAAYAEAVARRLAPVHDTAARQRSEGIPASVSLLDLLELDNPTPHALEARWHSSDERLGAPVGVAADGSFAIEAGQRDGLRMLIAGMPGAGKSELLQTLIAALAASHPPDRLTFLLVDYKGGAAFQDCVDLPHTVGLLTDLDAHLAERCRVSLMAELRRREHILREAGARSLRELARRDPGLAPPALIVLVDEFATLVREVPAFVETAIDVAQRGRSLGLHLVLATQRPRGAVNDTIRANTNLRIAMRVSDAAESQDIIEAPDAASIPAELPGRAITLTGRGPGGAPQLAEVQIAHAGGRSAGIAGGEGTVVVRDLRFAETEAPRRRVVSTVGHSSMTDLQAVVTAASEAARRLDLPSAPAPWLPPLPAGLDFDELPRPAAGQAMLGMLDEPGLQRQRPLKFDLERDGGMLVFGASGSGKTSLLRTLALSLALGASPRELQLYGLDFASRMLRQLELLPHCGSIVAGDDDERVQRLLGGLRRALAARRSRLAAGGDLSGLPRVLLLLDGYAAFAATYERVQYGDAVQTLTRLAAEGRPLGIHVVVTADRRADVPGALAGVVPVRVVFRMADQDDYVALVQPKPALAGVELPPGRGFLGDGTELQAAQVGEQRMNELARELAAAHPGVGAPTIGRLASHIPRDRLPAPARAWAAVVGVDDERLGPVEIDLAEGSLLVAGPRRSGRSTALATIAASLAQHGDVPLHLLAPRRSPLTELTIWASVARGADECRAAAETLASTEAPLVVMVDDAEEIAEGASATPLGELLRRSRDDDVRLLAAVESRAAQRLFGGWVRDLRGDQHGLLLQADAEVDGELLGVRIPRRGTTMPPGRGWLVQGGSVQLVQVAVDAVAGSLEQ